MYIPLRVFMYTKALEMSEGLLIGYNPIQNKKFKLKKKKENVRRKHKNEISGFLSRGNWD